MSEEKRSSQRKRSTVREEVLRPRKNGPSDSRESDNHWQAPYALGFLGKPPIKIDRRGGRFRQRKASRLLPKVPGQVRRLIETIAGIVRKGRNPRVEQFILIQPRLKVFLHSVLRKAGSLPILMDGLPVNAEFHGSSP